MGPAAAGGSVTDGRSAVGHAGSMSMRTVVEGRGIPWLKIYAAIFAVLSVVAGVFVLLALHRVLTWLVVAAFLALVLNPGVDLLGRRFHMRRGIATALVLLIALLLLAAMTYAFVRPIVEEAQTLADRGPELVADARAGRGPLGGLVERFDLERRLDENRDRIDEYVNQLGSNSLRVAAGVGTAVAGTLTVLVMTVLMLIEGPRMLQSALGALPAGRRERVRRVAADCARAVTGYMAGNLLISIIAGLSTLVFLTILGVPFKAVLALFVGVADLIPLVGATLGASVVVLVASLHSIPAGIAALVFYILYQQFENHVLQVTIMARTVQLNPLVVLVSVIVGVELSGILGALLAIPAAGIVQVIARDLFTGRFGERKAEPTIGVAEVPASRAGA